MNTVINRCQYVYPDGEQCATDRLLNHKKLCVRHRILSEKERGHKNYPGPVYYDHTAPWQCGDKSCVVCRSKPSYFNYMSKYKVAKQRSKKR